MIKVRLSNPSRLVMLVLMLIARPGAVAQEYSYKTLMMFGEPDLTTGLNPTGNLALGNDGRLYGTTGFDTNHATIFGVNRDGTGFTVLHRFGDVAGDGSYLVNGLIEGSDGALYGTTQRGGSQNFGTVFKINKDGSSYQILRNFLGFQNGDGANPQAGLIEGSDGALYGTTFFGGAAIGTVFRLNRDGTAYSIIRSLRQGGADGASPTGLIEATDGALYGMTYLGGSGQGGTIFKLNKDGSGFSVLWNLQQNSTNGFRALSSLLEGSDGFLYGSTTAGGVSSFGPGTVFKINKDGTAFGVLFAFAPGIGDQNDHPFVEGDDGALYGTRFGGGAKGYGNVYKLNKDGSGFALLHSFTATNDNGAFPYAGLCKGTNGEFYGSTSRGGKRGPSGDPADSYGTIFVLRRAASILGVSVQPNGQARLLFAGEGGKSYDIQATDTLSTAQWSKVGAVVAGADGRFQFEDSDAPNHPTRFYRSAEP